MVGYQDQYSSFVVHPFVIAEMTGCKSFFDRPGCNAKSKLTIIVIDTEKISSHSQEVWYTYLHKIKEFKSSIMSALPIFGE